MILFRKAPKKFHIQGDPRHWTPENLAMTQALYEIRNLKISRFPDHVYKGPGTWPIFPGVQCTLLGRRVRDRAELFYAHDEGIAAPVSNPATSIQPTQTKPLLAI